MRNCLLITACLIATASAEPITIRNPTRAGVTSIDAERIPVGVTGD